MEATPTLKPCPFCGKVPRNYDGDFVIHHKENCFLSAKLQEEWIVGKKAIKTWETRAVNNHNALLKWGFRKI